MLKTINKWFYIIITNFEGIICDKCLARAMEYMATWLQVNQLVPENFSRPWILSHLHC